MPTPVSLAMNAASILKSHQLLTARLWRTLGDYARRDRILHGLASKPRDTIPSASPVIC
jgi:hypothetical protein